MADCPFCAIVAGYAPATVVRRWADALAVVPLDPCTDGHLIVIPHTHVEHALTDPVITAATVERAVDLARRTGQAGHLIVNVGPEAGATVGHLHWHWVPRRPGDGVAMPWTKQRGESAGTSQDGEA